MGGRCQPITTYRSSAPTGSYASTGSSRSSRCPRGTSTSPRRPRGDVEVGPGVDLAGGQPRQSLRDAPDDADDREEGAGQRGPDVTAGAAPERPLQLLS